MRSRHLGSAATRVAITIVITITALILNLNIIAGCISGDGGVNGADGAQRLSRGE